MPERFRRLGDISGVAYTSPEKMDRTTLAGRDDVPQVDNFRSNYKLQETLSWPAGDTVAATARPCPGTVRAGWPGHWTTIALRRGRA